MTKNLFKYPLTGLVALLVASGNTYSQTSPDNLENLSLKDLLNVKITTVSKIAQIATQAPATVMVITSKQIRIRGYRNIAEVLNDLPDIKINDKSNPQFHNSINIRGINQQDKFVILMDGFRISSPTNDPLPLLENFPIYLAKQIEVVYGPGSALYGADAMAGVINIITEKGEITRRMKISTVGGTQGYNNNTLYYSQPLKNNYKLTLGGQYSYDKQPDFSKIYKEEYNMSAQQTGTFNSAYGPMKPRQPIDTRYQAPIKAFNFYLSLSKGGYDFKILHHYAEVPTSTTLKPDNGVYNKNVFYGQGVTTANMAYADSIGNLKSVTSILGSYYKVNPRSNYRNLYGGMEHGYKYSTGSMIKLDEQLSLMLSKVVHFVGGVTYELFQSMPKSPEVIKPIRGNGPVEAILLNSVNFYNPGGIEAKFYPLVYNNFGSFLQAQLVPIEKKLSFTIGLRYDHNSRFGSTINPRIGVVYNPLEGTTLKALYGTAYWAPSPQVTYSAYGSFYSLDSGRTYQSSFWHLPNPDLKPTTSHTAEVSISQKIGSNLNATLTAYYTHLHNTITDVSDNGNTNLYNNRFQGYQVDYIEVPYNEGVQKSYGGNIILNSAFKIGRSSFNSWSSISYVDGSVLEGTNNKTQLSLIAPLQFKIGIDGKSGRFHYSARLISMGKQRVTGFEDPAHPFKRQTINGYSLLNGSAGYTVQEKFTFFVNVQNALDQRYRNTMSADAKDTNASTFYGSLQDPLRLMAGVNLTF